MRLDRLGAARLLLAGLVAVVAGISPSLTPAAVAHADPLYGDPLVVPVLGIVTGETLAIS